MCLTQKAADFLRVRKKWWVPPPIIALLTILGALLIGHEYQHIQTYGSHRYQGRELSTVRKELHSAVAKRDSQAVTALMREESAIIGGFTSPGTTPLIEAVCRNHLDVVRFLLEQGAVVDARDLHGQMALLIAAAGDNPELVRLLLENGADINVQDRQGWTPLYWAQRSRRVRDHSIVELLEAHGAKE